MEHQSTIKITRLLATMLFCFWGATLQAQQLSAIIKGAVTDVYGHPLTGVVISTANGKNGTHTGTKGDYTLAIDDNSNTIIVSGKGYATQTIRLGSNETVVIRMQPDMHKKDEVVQLGYTSQLHRETSGAVATVSGEELGQAPVANFTQTLAGRLAGLTTMETYSELSRANTDLYIRGLSSIRLNSPLVVIDGIPVAYNASQTLEYISPNEVESVTLLKDASTQAIYGIQGAGGVIVVKTKRGIKGPLQVRVTFDQSVQQATTKPGFFSSAEYAEMRNQAAANDGISPLPFTPGQIANYKSGTNRALYPNNNWYDMFMKDLASMQRVGVNLTGGNDKVQFFSNLNVMHQGGYFKTDQPKYNPDANNVWVNFRSNVDMAINKYLKTFVRLAGNIKRERTPGAGNAAVYSSIFNTPSNVYGPITPKVTDNSGKVLDPGGKVIATINNPNPTYGLLNRSGYYRHTVTNIASQLGLDLDMSFLTKGLGLTGTFSYQTNSVGSLGATQDFERWVNTGSPDTLIFQRSGDHSNTPLAYSKTSGYYYHLSYNAAINYNRVFGKHSIGGMGYMFYQSLTKSDVSSPLLLPYNRVSSGVEATYGYDDRYYAKFDLGYSGSDQYARSHRYAATPAVSVAWVLSNESFLKDQNQWLSYLKLRASYGKAGNDQSGLNRYAYLNEIRLNGGGPIGYLQYSIDERTRANPNISAEISTKKNAGIDIGLFNALTITADVFHERMDNMVVEATGTVPSYQGVPLNYYPKFNTGVFDNKGYEISVNYNRQLNHDLGFNLGAMFSYAKNTVINIDEATLTSDYAYRKRQEGYSVGQQWGFLVDRSNGNGFFNTQTELDNNQVDYSQVGKPRLGDLKYRDLNHNGIIDDGDAAPVGTGSLPRVVYAVSGGLNYKSFELNLLFQGIGGYTTIESGIGVYETSYDGVFGSLHRNAWTQERYAKGQKITAPALSLSQSSSHQPGDYYAYDRAYLRLKNIQLSYTLPAAAAKAISAEKVRLLLSGQNLITWDKMKSKDYGPEGSGYAGFPVYRVYNVGINVTF